MLRFFDPTDEFLDWLAAHAVGKVRRLVFDVGCGEGHLVRQLRGRGVPAVGVDPRYQYQTVPPELVSAILPFEAQECKALHRCGGSLILFCRPCHSGFVGETIPLLHPTAEVLYVSKEENVRMDLDGFEWEEVESPPCPIERVYRVRR